MTFARSLPFLNPAKTILVPGMKAWGSFKYLNRFSSSQVTPEVELALV
eukprot:CAMPEP_0205803168 /NCGR_PEP_ID=MMETSP0205-20121125/5745_1 /ASSEMBLY_ACC=CAM_ASM_000278 /TAXON_ID=36767 /ORGANISM="Euplotes focardii, Strain TN1" /LENGTH=47 /DNA_ID= /DNA_START= /DNA_END= /DNA_ORIENTATION=